MSPTISHVLDHDDDDEHKVAKRKHKKQKHDDEHDDKQEKKEEEEQKDKTKKGTSCHVMCRGMSCVMQRHVSAMSYVSLLPVLLMLLVPHAAVAHILLTSCSDLANDDNSLLHLHPHR